MIRKNKNIIGEKRKFIYLNKVPHISGAELSSINKHKEKDTNLNVTNLANQISNRIQARKDALKELPPQFTQRLKKEIINYILSSPGRFENDENKGLSQKEFANFKRAMLNKVENLIKQYAPTKKEIDAKRKTQNEIRKAKESAKEVRNVELKDIKENPGKITNLNILSEKFGNYSKWNQSLQKQGTNVVRSIKKFQKQFQAFKIARNGLHAYKKFVTLFAGQDEESMNLMAIKKAMQKRLNATIKQIKEAQKKLENYGKKMREESNKQKQEKIKERDAKLKEIDANENLSEEEKGKRKEKYIALKQEKEELSKKRNDLNEYSKGLKETKQKKVTSRIIFAKTRKTQLKQYGSIISGTLEKIDKKLKDPTISEKQRQSLLKTKDVLTKKAKNIQYGEIASSATINGNLKVWNTLDEEEKKVAKNSYEIDSHIKKEVDPSINALGQHIDLLDKSMIQYSDSKKEVMKYYEKAFQSYDKIDEGIDSAILTSNLENIQIIEGLKSQKKTLSSMTIESTGLYEGTIGAIFSTTGAGIMHLGKAMVDNSIAIDRDLKEAKKWGMSPAKYWVGKITLEIVSAPMGAVVGALEMGGGLIQMIGNPVESLSGIGALIGRNPKTKEWSLGMIADTWTAMGKDIVSWEDFKKGQIGVGIGKIFTNVISTAIGAEAVSASGKTAAITAKMTRLRIMKVAGKIALKEGREMGLKGAKLGKFVRMAMENVKMTGKLRGIVSGAKAGSREFIRTASREVQKEIEKNFRQIEAVLKISATNPKEAVRILSQALKIANTKRFFIKDKLAKALKGLKKRNPEAFKLIENTELGMIIESQCFEPLIKGQRIEVINLNGKKVYVYIGKNKLGEGGFGRVDEVLFYTKGKKQLKRGAYKTALDNPIAKKILRKEIRDSQNVPKHPNLIRTLEAGIDGDNNFIIYETGSKAQTLEDALITMTADEWMSTLSESLKGLQKLHKSDLFHADFKDKNIIIYLNEKGERVIKIIDLSPIKMEHSLRVDWPRTPHHYFEISDLSDAMRQLLLKDGLTKKLTEKRLGVAHDTKASGLTMQRGLMEYNNIITQEKFAKLLPEQQQLLRKFNNIRIRMQDAYAASNPKAINEIREVLNKMRDEIRRCKNDPKRPNIMGNDDFRSKSYKRKQEEMADTIMDTPKTNDEKSTEIDPTGPTEKI